MKGILPGVRCYEDEWNQSVVKFLYKFPQTVHYITKIIVAYIDGDFLDAVAPVVSRDEMVCAYTSKLYFIYRNHLPYMNLQTTPYLVPPIYEGVRLTRSECSKAQAAEYIW